MDVLWSWWRHISRQVFLLAVNSPRLLPTWHRSVCYSGVQIQAGCFRIVKFSLKRFECPSPFMIQYVPKRKIGNLHFFFAPRLYTNIHILPRQNFKLNQPLFLWNNCLVGWALVQLQSKAKRIISRQYICWWYILGCQEQTIYIYYISLYCSHCPLFLYPNIWSENHNFFPLFCFFQFHTNRSSYSFDAYKPNRYLLSDSGTKSMICCIKYQEDHKHLDIDHDFEGLSELESLVYLLWFYYPFFKILSFNLRSIALKTQLLVIHARQYRNTSQKCISERNVTDTLNCIHVTLMICSLYTFSWVRCNIFNVYCWGNGLYAAVNYLTKVTSFNVAKRPILTDSNNCAMIARCVRSIFKGFTVAQFNIHLVLIVSQSNNLTSYMSCAALYTNQCHVSHTNLQSV